MIYYVTGPLGAGKTFYVSRKMGKALLEGKAVAGNVRLVDEWPEIIARHNPYSRLSKVRTRQYVKELRSRYHFEEDLELLMHLRLKGRGEGRGVRVLDEAHNEVNNLDYLKTESQQLLKRITLGRKEGWDDYIVSQHAGNTLAGLRRIATIKIALVNYKQITKFPFLEMALIPFPLFVATARPNKEAFEGTGAGNKASSKKRPLFREVFLLSWHKDLYATDQVYGDDPDNPFRHYLPSPPEERELVRLAFLESKKRTNGKSPVNEPGDFVPSDYWDERIRLIVPPRQSENE